MVSISPPSTQIPTENEAGSFWLVHGCSMIPWFGVGVNYSPTGNNLEGQATPEFFATTGERDMHLIVLQVTDFRDFQGFFFVFLGVVSLVSLVCQAYLRTLFSGGISFFDQLDYFYPPQPPAGPDEYNSTHQRLEWLFGDAFIACISGYAASAATNLLSKMYPDPPAWKFLFAYPGYSTSYHGSYGPYVYTAHMYDQTDDSPPARIARSLTAYFTSFILHQDPNIATSGTPPFPRYGDGLNVLLIGSDGQLSNITDLDAGPRCQFLQAHPLEYSV